MVEVDALDLKILKMLQEEGRIPFTEMAVKAKVKRINN